MSDFLEWVFDDAPRWVPVLFLMVLGVWAVVLVVFSIHMLASGKWWVPMIIWAAIPLILLGNEYQKYKDRQK